MFLSFFCICLVLLITVIWERSDIFKKSVRSSSEVVWDGLFVLLLRTLLKEIYFINRICFVQMVLNRLLHSPKCTTDVWGGVFIWRMVPYERNTKNHLQQSKGAQENYCATWISHRFLVMGLTFWIASGQLSCLCLYMVLLRVLPFLLLPGDTRTPLSQDGF